MCKSDGPRGDRCVLPGVERATYNRVVETRVRRVKDLPHLALTHQDLAAMEHAEIRLFSAIVGECGDVTWGGGGRMEKVLKHRLREDIHEH